MRFQAFLYAAACIGVLAACTEQPAQPQAEEQQAEAPAGVHSRGVVVAITREYNAITIQHEPIPEFQMDAMTMEFTVAEPSQLEGIAVGDQVSFVLSGPIDIASITVTSGE